jgi:hypothetical protein
MWITLCELEYPALSQPYETGTMDESKRRGDLIRVLEQALFIAEELRDGTTEYLVERALDEARSRRFKPSMD